MIWSEQIIAVGMVCTSILQILALRKIGVVHKVINSRLDKWLAVEREQGQTAGREAERQEAKDKESIKVSK
jgi:hypothetical protein